MENLIGRKIEMTCTEGEYGWAEYLGQTGTIVRTWSRRYDKRNYVIELDSGKTITTLRNRFKYTEIK